MRVLSIAASSLRRTSRRRSTSRWRVASATVATALLVLSGPIGRRWFPGAALGQAMIMVVSFWTLLFCFVAGIHSAADSLSREKREETLGVLFLAGLKAPEIVFGKFVCAALNAIYGLIAAAPVLLLALLWGGLNASELARVGLALLNTLFFALSVGMLGSALARREGNAILGALIVTLGFTLIPAVLHIVLSRNAFASAFNVINPYEEWRLAFDAPFAADAKRFWLTHSIVHVLSWSFLGLSVWLLNRAWKASSESPQFRPRSTPQNIPRAADPARSLQLLNRNPMLWLWIRRHASSIPGLILIATTVGFGLASVFLGNSPANLKFGVVVALLVTLKTWIARDAACRLIHERRAGTLEILLTTPVRVRDILRDHYLWLERRFILPLTVVFAALLIFLITSDGDLFIALNLLLLIPDALALGWAGLWLGLKCRHSGAAAFGAAARILFMPAIIPLGLFAVGFDWALIVWFILGLTADGVFGLSAYLELQHRFRALAATELDEGPDDASGIAVAYR